MIHERTFFIVLTFFALLSSFYTQSANAKCVVTAVSGIYFGDYDVFSLNALTGTGSFAVTGCSNGANSYVATLSKGRSNTYTSRTMRSGKNSLDYNLYTDATHNSIWGSGSGGTSSVSITNSGSGIGSSITIYGKIPAEQDLPDGIYADNITITIAF